MLVVDETQSDMRALIKSDFGALDPAKDFLVSFLDWLHFRARRIPRKSRDVVASSEIQSKRDGFPAVDAITREFRSGGDLGPWLSDSVRRQMTDHKADLMFNDWGISHFHLGRMFLNPRKVKRSSDLLFAYVEIDHVVLLDIQPHGSWSLHSLLEILLRTHPADMTRYELKGVMGSGSNRTADDVLKLRKAGASTYYEVNGRLFMPDLGISTSGHSTKIVRFTQNLLRQIKNLRQMIERNELPAYFMLQVAGTLPLAIKLGVRLEANEFVIHDKNRRIDFMRLPF